MTVLEAIAAFVMSGLTLQVGRWLERRRWAYLHESWRRDEARLNGECEADKATIHKLFELLGNELRGGKRP